MPSARAIAVAFALSGLAPALSACASKDAPAATTQGQSTPSHGQPVHVARCGGGGGPAPRPSGRNPFTGRATTIGPGFGCAPGAVTVVLSTGLGADRRGFSVELSAPACPPGPSCLRLSGTLTGKLSPHRSLPDVGVFDQLSGRGSAAPLGTVTVTGAVTGTGFIARGHESLRLVLRGSKGTVTVAAVSRTVPGFTHP